MDTFEVEFNVSPNYEDSNDITDKINLKNTKKVAFGVVVCLILYHAILNFNFSIDSCKWLLSDGRFHGKDIWQPYGCMMHKYSKIDARRCIRKIFSRDNKSQIMFMGDSRIRQFFFALINKISFEKMEPEVIQKDLYFYDQDLPIKISFKWCPVINETMKNNYLDLIHLNLDIRPSIIITGIATWTIKQYNGSDEALNEFKMNLANLLPIFNKLGQKSQLLWVLQHPVIKEELSKDRKMITNEQIDLFNKASIDILRNSESENVRIWSSSRLVSQGEIVFKEKEDKRDGLHLSDFALDISIQMFLNWLCNSELNFQDGSCCSKPENITQVQFIAFVLFGIIILLTIIFLVYKKYFDTEPKFKLLLNKTNFYDDQDSVLIDVDNFLLKIFIPLSKLGIIMFYFFICDRTNFFMKENKYFTLSNFFLPIAYLFAHGLFFTEESNLNNIIHRNQSNEWKGWMQLIILAYHMTGASQKIPIYMFARYLVSSYLFLSGFANFTYFWKTGDVSLHRFCKMIFRMNLLVVTLCICMNRSYQFYYFVPLISFWYVIIHITMALLPRTDAQIVEHASIGYFYMVLKFVVLLSVITVLYVSEVFFKKIFFNGPWKSLFVYPKDSVFEWWLRWKIDRYSVPAGMIFSFLYHTFKKYNFIDDNGKKNLFSIKNSYIFSIFASLGIIFYLVFSFTCSSKASCNEIHPYIVFIPILSFIFLRNIFFTLRACYSYFFAWFGKISLELFICQYHILLAADTRGVLVFIPSYPILNLLITSFIFIFVAHELHSITQTLAKYAIPTDLRYLIRNLVIFLFIIIIMIIKHGMFF